LAYSYFVRELSKIAIFHPYMLNGRTTAIYVV